MNKDTPRLIEVAFPLKQASLDSVHEKNVRHGHISTLHIWPARRPLAACRAALIATLLPDPGNDIERKALLEKLAGVVKQENTFKTVGDHKIPFIKEFTEGGILHWGRENGPALDYFREEIKKAYGGRAPRVLDPFAGGGAIPLEAMRLGCEATAADLNPVAWFILKCTLEYPQKFAGKTRPLPSFAIHNPEFMAEFMKGTGQGKKPTQRKGEEIQGTILEAPDADLSWHVRAWGYWVLERARKDLERFYPTIDDKPTVAYLWARTVTCKNCRATIPLLKTLWLCKKNNKRIRLRMKPRSDRSGVDFEILNEPVVSGNATQRRAHDQQISRGTMSRSGVWCPVCGNPDTIALTLKDIGAEGMACRFGRQMTTVVVDGLKGKEYRLPVQKELETAQETAFYIDKIFKDIPFGLPEEPLPGRDRHRAVGSQLPNYGLKCWADLFTSRQMLVLGTFVKTIRSMRKALQEEGYPIDFVEAISAYLFCVFDRMLDFNSIEVSWITSVEAIGHTFVRYALPMTWDYSESAIVNYVRGGWRMCLDAIIDSLETITKAVISLPPKAEIHCGSALRLPADKLFDIILTDPPYYDAIPYSDIMDFFFVWLRRNISDIHPNEFLCNLSEKREELVQQHNTGPEALPGKLFYEEGMSHAFQAAYYALSTNGRLVIVFANKQPDAWETLAASIIKAGFVVDATWPIETEQPNRIRAQGTASLSSSVWIVCRKRDETTRPGWDNRVIEEMRENIEKHLPRFWDAGIRGPDFIWAATGPALEAYSKYPAVKKADQPDSLMTVSEFLGHVRRLVVDFAVGRILSSNGENVESLDDLTVYYLLHRQSFGMEEAPVGAIILYAQSCNLRDRDLVDRFDLLAHGKSKAETEEEEEPESDDDSGDETGTSGSTVKLKRWDNRKNKDLGLGAPGRTTPLIDRVHRIMQLWRTGDVQKVDSYLEETGLRRSAVFPKLLQSLIELARKDAQADEVALLESIMNYITARGMHPQMRLMPNEDNP